MIRVGINEEVKLKGAEINDKGTLVISFTQKGDNTAKVNVDDLLNKVAEVKAGNGATSIMIFPPSVEYNGETREVKDIAQAIGGVRDQLEHLLQGYMTSEAAALDPYTGIDTDDVSAFQASLTKQATIDKIYKNLVNGFISRLKDVEGDLETKTFRLLLIRRSAANHYGTLRSRFINSNPFWEPMTIPFSASNLRFTKYEVSKGLNNPNPVSKDEPTNTTAEAEQSNVADILGTR